VMDYTCARCGVIDQRLQDALKLMGDDAPAVLVVFCPLNRNCNKQITETLPAYQHACDLAELALGVWHTDAKQFPAYHRWLLENQKGMTPQKAHAKALELLGEIYATEHGFEGILEQIMAKGWPARDLSRDVKISVALKAGSLPLLIYNDQRLEILPDTAEKLAEVLRLIAGP
jgi:protein-disulfide isomerase